jgi:hypothetical protein
VLPGRRLIRVDEGDLGFAFLTSVARLSLERTTRGCRVAYEGTSASGSWAKDDWSAPSIGAQTWNLGRPGRGFRPLGPLAGGEGSSSGDGDADSDDKDEGTSESMPWSSTD